MSKTETTSIWWVFLKPPNNTITHFHAWWNKLFKVIWKKKISFKHLLAKNNMLLVMQCRNRDFCRACLSILRSVVQLPALHWLRTQLAWNPASRQACVSWQVPRIQARVHRQAGKWLSVCIWISVQTSAEAARKPTYTISRLQVSRTLTSLWLRCAFLCSGYPQIQGHK